MSAHQAQKLGMAQDVEQASVSQEPFSLLLAKSRVPQRGQKQSALVTSAVWAVTQSQPKQCPEQITYLGARGPTFSQDVQGQAWTREVVVVVLLWP